MDMDLSLWTCREAVAAGDVILEDVGNRDRLPACLEIAAAG